MRAFPRLRRASSSSWRQTVVRAKPFDPTNPTARFLDGRGEGVYQLSFMVDDVDAAAATLRAEGLRSWTAHVR